MIAQTTARTTRAPAIELDESRHPLIVVTFRGMPTEAEFDTFLAGLGRAVRRPGKKAMLHDARESGGLSPTQRRALVDWMRENEGVLHKNMLGSAVVIDSPVIRGVFTAILWMHPLPHPHHLTSSLAEGESWALERIRAAGLTHERPTRP